MRIVGEIPHPGFKITLLSWNNKYLIKFERGPLEQTFKIPEFELTNEAELHTFLDKTFLIEVEGTFDKMEESFVNALKRQSGIA